jgi:Carboxypeptidase regulatory-like domain
LSSRVSFIGTAIASAHRPVMRTLLIVALLFPALAHAQPSACHDAEVVFVGRAEQSVTYHISGEAFIEQARQNVTRVEEEVSRERAASGPQMRLERDIELERRRIEAMDELEQRQDMYPEPYYLRLVPLRIEDGFRGVTESTVMLLDRNLPRQLEPDQSYLIIGIRSTDLLPPFPEMADLSHVNSYIEAIRAVPVTSAKQEVAFLTATRSGATILGTLRRHTWGDGQAAPISDARVVILSSGQMLETVTKNDGSFAVFGIPAGRVEIKPVLPANLTIFNKSALMLDVREGACGQVQLTAAVNGRVRGRVVSASGRSIKGATLYLSRIDPTQFRSNPNNHYSSAHSPQLNASAAEDGTFEFYGVPAGTYLLTASVPRMVDNKEATPTTYYPGTSERSAAIPVNVGDATEHDGFDFVVRTE